MITRFLSGFKKTQMSSEILVIMAVLIDLMSFSLFRLITEQISVANYICFRSLCAGIFLGGYHRFQSKDIAFPHEERWIVFIRGILGGLSILLFIYAMGQIDFSSSVSLFYTGPIFAIISATFLYRTRLSPFQMIAILLGVIGGLYQIFGEGMTSFNTSSVLIVFAALFYGCSVSLIKKLQKTPVLSTQIAYNVICFLLTLPFVNLNDFSLMTPNLVLMIFITVFSNLLMNGLYLSAYRKGCSSTLPLFDYAAIPLSFIVGYVVWHESPTMTGVCGAFLIVLSGTMIILHKKRVRLEA